MRASCSALSLMLLPLLKKRQRARRHYRAINGPALS